MEEVRLTGHFRHHEQMNYPLSSERFTGKSSLEKFLTSYMKSQVKSREKMFPFLTTEVNDNEKTRVADRVFTDVVGYWSVWVPKLKPLLEPWVKGSNDLWLSIPIPKPVKALPQYKSIIERLQAEANTLYRPANRAIILSFICGRGMETGLIMTAFPLIQTFIKKDEIVDEKMIQTWSVSGTEGYKPLLTTLDSLRLDCPLLKSLIALLLLQCGFLRAMGLFQVSSRSSILEKIWIKEEPFKVNFQDKHGKLYGLSGKYKLGWSPSLDIPSSFDAGPVHWSCLDKKEAQPVWKTVISQMRRSFPHLQELCKSDTLLETLWKEGHHLTERDTWYSSGGLHLLSREPYTGVKNFPIFV